MWKVGLLLLYMGFPDPMYTEHLDLEFGSRSACTQYLKENKESLKNDILEEFNILDVDRYSFKLRFFFINCVKEESLNV